VNQSDIHIAEADMPPKVSHILSRSSMKRVLGSRPMDTGWPMFRTKRGRPEVYVRPFRGQVPASEGQIQVARGRGDFPVWSRTGNELFL
jgi:hypothetical protein